MKLGNINGHRYAEFSYSECVKAFGTSDFANRLDCVNVSAQNDSLIVYSVCCINIEDKTVVSGQKSETAFCLQNSEYIIKLKLTRKATCFCPNGTDIFLNGLILFSVLDDLPKEMVVPYARGKMQKLILRLKLVESPAFSREKSDRNDSKRSCKDD